MNSHMHDPSPWAEFWSWSRRARWRRVIFGLVVAVLIAGMVAAAIPTIDSTASYLVLKVRTPGAFERAIPGDLRSSVRVIDRKTTLDLSGWQYTSSRDLDSVKKISRGFTTTTFVVRKTQPGAKYFVHTVSSGSKIPPTIWCDSHPYQVVQANNEGQSPIRQWNILVDISDEPDDRPFTVSLAVTFWNAFQKKEDWWAGFRVLHPTEKSTFHVIFPAGMPPSDVRFTYKDITSGETVDLPTATQNVTPVPTGKPIPELAWTLDNPLPERGYRLTWTWPNTAAPA